MHHQSRCDGPAYNLFVAEKASDLDFELAGSFLPLLHSWLPAASID
jgi:hypothetical protein